MKLAYVCPRYYPRLGGIELHVRQIAGHLSSEGHEVDVLTQETDAGLKAIERIDGVTVRRFKVPYTSDNYAVAPGLASYLVGHARDYDVVHAHGYHALPAFLAAVAPARRLVFTPHYHGTGHSRFRSLLHRPYRAIGAFLLRRSDAVICVSEAEATLLRRHFPAAGGRITVIPNGVDLESLSTVRPYGTDRVVVLCAGRLERYKQLDRVLEAVAHLPPEFELRVVGDGPARRLLTDAVRRLGISDRVHLLGRLEDTELHRWLKTARVYVTMSRHEAFGLTLAEAISAGTPAVASDIPAHREIARRSEPAVSLLPVDAAPALLAEAIRATALAPPPIPLRPAQSWSDVATETAHVYGATLARPPGAAA